LISDKWHRLGIFYGFNGLADIKAIVFVAFNVKKINNSRKDPLDKDLFEIKKYSISETETMIKRNIIKDGPTISAFYIFLLKKDKGFKIDEPQEKI